MNNIKHFPTTNYDSFFQRVYFSSIINNIISFADLRDTSKTILDFGCGEKILSKKLQNVNVLNYDIKPEYSDYKTYKNLKFDIVVFNHVLMYFYPNEIENLMDELKLINPKCKIIIGLGKQNLVSKIGKFITGNINAHIDTKSSYNAQIDILNKKSKINKIKKNIFFMTDIYYAEFL
jgi:2-polyprenyl-3-methyl-5-hydroxy-6-metoxy-1,4-benzoquinol methylase